MNTTKQSTDFSFFTYYLPNYYVQNSRKDNREEWRCRSNTGLSDMGDEKEWNAFVKEVHNRWPMRFIEIYHTVNTNHKDFTIYLKSE